MTSSPLQGSALSAFEPTPDALAGRSIVVTGASDGIGRAVAIAAAKLGAHLFLLGRSEDKLNAVYDEIEALGNHHATLVPLDLAAAEEQHYQELADFIATEKQSLQGLVHCAGELGNLGPLQQCSGADFERILKVNLSSNFLLTKACIPLLAASEASSIVFTSSSVGRLGRAFWGSYSVSKFGVEALSQIWAQELQATENIRVNSLNPGATNTAMRRRAYPGETPSDNPSAEEISRAYLYLLCDESLAINGQQLDAQAKK